MYSISKTRSWIKAPSQLRREKRRKDDREKSIKETEEVFEKSGSKILSFMCDHCDASFKSKKRLEIHVRKAHKTEVTSVPEKERGVSSKKDLLLTLTPAKQCRE